MYAKQLKKTIAIGQNSLVATAIIEKIITFLHSNLPLFKKHLTESQFDDDREKLLNQKLSLFLNTRSRSYEFSLKRISPLYFHFVKDNDLADSRSQPDIGVFLGSQDVSSDESFFHIECKRLPSPTEGGRSEKEYVIGNNYDGGMERYKLERHGGALEVSALIAYIQDGTITEWQKRINVWINELSHVPSGDGINWDKSDELVSNKKFSAKYKTQIASFKSINSRIKYEPITLVHFWIKIN